jgi:3-oxoacyl-[acyl-carrier protein] reductase
MDLGLAGRVAIVAAGSQGLGKAAAAALAREGARVAICARGAAALERAAQEIGGDVLAAQVDVTREEEVREFVAQVRGRWGAVDICVTNAGGPPAKPFETTTVADWRAAFELNFLSTVFFAREVLPEMKRRRWGRLLTVTSVSVKEPIDSLVLSNAVRAAVAGLVKSLANEYGPHNVLVNNVCPGYTKTDRLAGLAEALASQSGATLAEIEQRWTSRVPLGRLGTPEEFANVVAFLASERASYVNGESIAVDGGYVRGIFG